MNNLNLVEKLATAYESLTNATRQVLTEAHENLSAQLVRQSVLPLTQAYLNLINAIEEELQSSGVTSLEQKLSAACNAIKSTASKTVSDIESPQGSYEPVPEKKMISYSDAIKLWAAEDKKAGRREVTRTAYFHRFKVLDEENVVYIEKLRDRIHRVDEDGLLKAIGEYVYSATNGRPRVNCPSEKIAKNANMSYKDAMNYMESQDKINGFSVGIRSRQMRINNFIKNGLEVNREGKKILGINQEIFKKILADFYQSRSSSSVSNSRPSSLEFVSPETLQSGRENSLEGKEKYISSSQAITYCRDFEKSKGLLPRSGHACGEWLRRYIKPLEGNPPKIRLVPRGDLYDLNKVDLDKELEAYIQRKLNANKPRSITNPTESKIIVQANTQGNKLVEKVTNLQSDNNIRRQIWLNLKVRVQEGENVDDVLDELKIFEKGQRFGYTKAIERYVTNIKPNSTEN